MIVSLMVSVWSMKSACNLVDFTLHNLGCVGSYDSCLEPAEVAYLAPPPKCPADWPWTFRSWVSYVDAQGDYHCLLKGYPKTLYTSESRVLDVGLHELEQRRGWIVSPCVVAWIQELPWGRVVSPLFDWGVFCFVWFWGWFFGWDFFGFFWVIGLGLFVFGLFGFWVWVWVWVWVWILG